MCEAFDLRVAHNIRPIGQGIETGHAVFTETFPLTHNIRPIGQGIETNVPEQNR